MTVESDENLVLRHLASNERRRGGSKEGSTRLTLGAMLANEEPSEPSAHAVGIKVGSFAMAGQFGTGTADPMQRICRTPLGKPVSIDDREICCQGSGPT